MFDLKCDCENYERNSNALAIAFPIAKSRAESRKNLNWGLASVLVFRIPAWKVAHCECCSKASLICAVACCLWQSPFYMSLHHEVPLGISGHNNLFKLIVVLRFNFISFSVFSCFHCPTDEDPMGSKCLGKIKLQYYDNKKKRLLLKKKLLCSLIRKY